MSYRHWTVALSTLAGIAFVTAASVGAGTAWASIQADHQRQEAADLNQRRTDADARAAASVGEWTEVRLAFDPDVASAAATLTERLGSQACDQARALVAAGKAVPAGSDLAQPVLVDAPQEFPALADLPGWEAKVDLAAVDRQAQQCADAARARKKKAAAARKAAASPAEQQPEADGWVTIESNGPTGKERVYDPDGTIRNGGSDPDRCIHDGKQYCSD